MDIRKGCFRESIGRSQSVKRLPPSFLSFFAEIRVAVFSVIVAVIVAVAAGIGAGISSYADYRVIYTKPVEYTDLAPGIVREYHQIFTDEGWIVANVVRSSLNAAKTVIPLYPDGKLTVPKTLSEMAEGYPDTVVAINGDYFDYVHRSVLGRMIDRGKVVQTSNKSSQLAHFSIDKDGRAQIGYENNAVGVVIHNGKEYRLDFINKAYRTGTSFMLFDRSFGSHSPGVFLGSSGQNQGKSFFVSEFQVTDGVITDVISGENGSEKLAVPEGTLYADCYVLHAQGEFAKWLLTQWSEGDSLSLHPAAFPYTSISGGAQLIRDGKVVEEFTHNILGEHPRTAVGIEKDQKTLMFVTVNGRSGSYRGIRQSELAELMLKLGAHEALILDGGGSSEMLIRNPYRNRREIVSFLSDGSERRIYNGLSVQHRSVPSSQLYKHRWKEPKLHAVVGVPVTLEVEAIDTAVSNYEVKNVSYEALGVRGSFQGNRFIPSSPGSGAIVAKIGERKAYADIRVSEKAQRLIVKEEEGVYSFFLETSDGYRVPVPGESVSVYVDGGIARFDVESGRMIPRSENESGYVTFSYYISDRDVLSVSLPLKFGGAVKMLEDFEDEPLRNSTSDEQKMSIVRRPDGEGKVGAIAYRFDSVNARKQIAFFENAVRVPKGVRELQMDLYAKTKENVSVKAVAQDSKGSIFLIPIVENVEREGWNTVQFPVLREGAEIQLLVVETEKESGELYFDNIRYHTEHEDPEYIPKEIHLVKKYEDYQIQTDQPVYVIGYHDNRYEEHDFGEAETPETGERSAGESGAGNTGAGRQSAGQSGQGGQSAGQSGQGIGAEDAEVQKRERKERYEARLNEAFHYLEIKNTGGYIRRHDGVNQWNRIMNTLRHAQKPVVIRFSDTYYFPDKMAMDLLFTLVEECPQPVVLVCRAYRGETDITRHRGALIVEIKAESELLDMTQDLDVRIRNVEGNDAP